MNLMCGIVGILNKDRSAVDKNLIKSMSRVLRYRGPDEEGFYWDSWIGFGIQRLKVIDLKTGSQPIHNEDGSVWTVFNGAIYNYQELHNILKCKGHKFYTVSDTETILHAYEEWGDRFLQHLNGIYGFALWDKTEQRLLLVRDRLGVKPLYYYETPNMLVFASEIKALLLHPAVKREIDFDAFNNYLSLAYVPAPLTMFKNTKKLLPGHMLIWQGGITKIKQYWDVSYEVEEGISEQTSLDRLHSVLKRAVRSQLISDVPLGIFLSGGIDSSILVSLMSQIKERPVTTFSIAYEEDYYNESGYAKLVADHFRTDHYEFLVRSDIFQELPEIVEHLDEPLADAAALPTILLSKLAKEHVTVVLNGAGGDEIFGGYDRYRRQKFLDWYMKVPEGIRKLVLIVIEKLVPGDIGNFKAFKNRAKMIAEAAKVPLSERYITWASVLSADCRGMILSDQLKREISQNDVFLHIKSYFDNSDLDDVSTMMYVDAKTYLVDDILTMTDKMSMAYGLKIRVPFLDHDVVEFAATLPVRYKVRNGKSKYLLRKYLSNNLPKRIWNRPKQGFMVPISSWLRKKGYFEYAREILLSKSAMNRGLFNAKGIERILIDHQKGYEDYGGAIWALLNFELWSQKFLDNQF